MRVGVECFRRCGVPEAPLNDLHSLTVAVQQRRVEVPQVVKRGPYRRTGPLDGSGEHMREPVTAHRLALGRREYKLDDAARRAAHGVADHNLMVCGREGGQVRDAVRAASDQ